MKKSTSVQQQPQQDPTTINNNLQNEDCDFINDEETRLPQLIKQLQDLMQEEGATWSTNFKPSEDILTIFLRVRGYNVERSLTALKRVNKFLERHKIHFEDIKPKSIESAFDALSIYCLKHTDASKCGVLVAHFDSWEPSTVPVLIKLNIVGSWLHETLWSRKEVQINGVHIIVDLNGLSWAHAKLLTPNEIKRCLITIEDGFPIKIVGMHYINYPSIFWPLFYLATRFMSKKLRNRIHFHERLESLHAHFSPTILPVQLGGDLTKEEALDADILESIMKLNQNFTNKYNINNNDDVTL